MIGGKYVISSQGPVLFPDTFNHSDFVHMNPTSAGKFLISRNTRGKVSVMVYGDSFTLGLKSDKDDALRIESLFRVDAYE